MAKNESDTKNFSDFERQAMKDRAAEVKAQKADKTRAGGQKQLDQAIADMPDGDRKLAETIAGIVAEVAPELMPRTYYGMPAWAREGKVLCFFQPAGKFKTRYCTLGFEDKANLDDGNFWPVGYALTEKLTDADVKKLTALVKKAVG